jgi:hypothetical protein
MGASLVVSSEDKLFVAMGLESTFEQKQIADLSIIEVERNVTDKF